MEEEEGAEKERGNIWHHPIIRVWLVSCGSVRKPKYKAPLRRRRFGLEIWVF